ncbi:hypothetical protein JCM1841_005672 [Sporobolomyces salmonicolor]
MDSRRPSAPRPPPRNDPGASLSRESATPADRLPQAHRSIIILSPRESPTPTPGSATATRVLSPLPTVRSPPTDEPQHPRTILTAQQLTGDFLSEAYYFSPSGALLPNPRSPSGPIPHLPENEHDADPESADQGYFLLEALRAGSDSRARRLAIAARTSWLTEADEAPQAMELAGSSPLAAAEPEQEDGWVYISGSATSGMGQLSPEERRAARLERIATQADAIEGDGDLQRDLDALRELHELRRELEWEIARGEEGGEPTAGRSIWRNSPLSIPRTSSLPRGGRTVPLPFPSTSISPLSSTPRPPVSTSSSTFSPSNPPSRLTSQRTPLHFTPRPTLFESTSTVADREARGLPPPSFSSPGGSRYPTWRHPGIEGEEEPASDADGTDRPGTASRAQTYAESRDEPYAWPEARHEPVLAAEAAGDGEGAAGMERTGTIVYHPPSTTLGAGGGTGEARAVRRERADRVLDELRVIAREGDREQGGGARGGGTTRPRRTREEVNALSGRALRSKKCVWLLYCGGSLAPSPASSSSSNPSSPGDDLPAGFSFTAPPQNQGCGALVCSRALLDGVPTKVFVDNGVEEPAASSDLPPVAGKVGDLLDDEDGEGREKSMGERVGKRGWRGCKGCVTRDLACRRCGNHLGYRLLRPDVICSISRPSYTSYASAVASVPASSAGSASLLLSAGGVTGGGIVDGLLFHFRREGVTALRRRVGERPEEEIGLERARRRREGKGKGKEEEVEDKGARLKEKMPRRGEEMLWKHIPSPQRDFVDNLISEPSDWISPASETWWLDNAISKHTRKRTASGALVQTEDTDRLSNATTTLGGGPPTGRESLFSPRVRTSSSGSTGTLNRSHAIRVRVPVSSHPSQASSPRAATSGPEATYDRYRSDAQAFQRRVRQRLGESESAGEGVGRRLEGAGYGSGFDGDEEREGESERERRRDRGRERVGR